MSFLNTKIHYMSSLSFKDIFSKTTFLLNASCRFNWFGVKNVKAVPRSKIPICAAMETSELYRIIISLSAIVNPTPIIWEVAKSNPVTVLSGEGYVNSVASSNPHGKYEFKKNLELKTNK